MARNTLIAFTAIIAAGVTTIGGAGAAWQDTHKALRIGFLATDGAVYDMRKLEPFRTYLQAAIGMPVELVPATSYAALIDAQATDRVQYAIDSATSYVSTVGRCNCVEPMAVPAAFDGAHGFYAIILARSDSDIHTPADARGKTLAVTTDDSIAGRLVPLKYLARDGINAGTDLQSVQSAADPAAAIAALEAGSVDLAVGWSSLTGDPAGGYDFGVLNSLVHSGALSMDTVRIVWQSPLIPFGPHTIRTDVPGDLKAHLVSALAAMATVAPAALDAVDRSSTGGGGFAPVTAEDYAVIADLVGIASSGANGPAPTLSPAPGSTVPSAGLSTPAVGNSAAPSPAASSVGVLPVPATTNGAPPVGPAGAPPPVSSSPAAGGQAAVPSVPAKP